jgi:hypothetical protein
MGDTGYFVLCKSKRLCYTLPAREHFRSFLGSSAVEHSTVNRMVAGSNPARGASEIKHLAKASEIEIGDRVCTVSTDALPERLRHEFKPWLYAAALILLAAVAFAAPPPRCEDVPRIAIGEVMPLGDRH